MGIQISAGHQTWGNQQNSTVGERQLIEFFMSQRKQNLASNQDEKSA